MKYAVISDLHANLTALQKVLADAARNGADAVVCLGDVVGYGPLPADTVAQVRKSSSIVLAGNHDDAVSGRLDHSDFIDLAGDAVERHHAQLSKDDLAWLRSLPYTACFGDAIATHGDLTNPEAFNYIDSDESAADNFAQTDASLMFAGHTHTPCIYVTGASGRVYRLEPQDFILEDGKRYIINPGSVGYPRESDGRCFSSYVLYDSSERTITFRKLPFAVSSVMQRGGIRHFTRAMPLVIAAVAAIGIAAAAILLTIRHKSPPAERQPITAAENADDVPFTARTLTLPRTAANVSASLKMEKGSPPVQVEARFLDANGTSLSHESRLVKASFTKKLSVPNGAVSVKFTVLRTAGAGEPKIKSFAPYVVQDNAKTSAPTTRQ